MQISGRCQHKVYLLPKQLEQILEYFEKLAEVDTAGVEPMTHVLKIDSVMREDETSLSLPLESILANAPSVEADSFKVPRILTE
jgi:aspartyl-tRNA(Asn)/glutamyl-tRNA(Gln) amidotransferase subunit C